MFGCICVKCQTNGYYFYKIYFSTSLIFFHGLMIDLQVNGNSVQCSVPLQTGHVWGNVGGERLTQFFPLHGRAEMRVKFGP